jgi:phosphonopyruvate decarboxylase
LLNVSDFTTMLVSKGISFFTGVPDSLLKDFCAHITDVSTCGKHIIAANEGGAIGLAAGHFLATGSPALVYMQNSGIGNAVNPLLSLADPEVYGIPLILLIGWRGEPGKHDEPQHVKQGKVTLSTFETFGIPYYLLPSENVEVEVVLTEAIHNANSRNGPVALIVKQGVFEPYYSKEVQKLPRFNMSREDAIKRIVECLPENSVVVATTGHISRELYEYREVQGQGHKADFLTVGSMGHASQIAYGIAMNHPDRIIVCIDGDGATLMHLGSLAIIGQSRLKNYRHFVLNNGAHDSVGGQPTVGLEIDLPAIARASGYAYSSTLENHDDMDTLLSAFFLMDGPSFLEIKVDSGARKNLGRPKSKPEENKKNLMDFLRVSNE